MNQVGTCVSKMTTDTTLNLFVSGATEEDDADGTYSKPFRHLVKALDYANSEVAHYRKGTVNIYLLNNDHIMSRGIVNYHYEPERKDKYSGNQAITIQPAF